MKRAGIFASTLVAAVLLSACGDDVELKPVEETTSAVETQTTEPSEQPSEPETSAEEPSSAPASEPAPSTDSSDSAEALKKYVEGAQAQIPKIQEQYPGVYKDVRIEAEGSDTVVLTYVYAQEVDDEFAESFKSREEENRQLAEPSFAEMEQMGVKPVQRVKLVFQQPDGSEIWSKTYSSDDTATQPGSSSSAAQPGGGDSTAALNKYVQAEAALAPRVLQEFDGLYSSLSVEAEGSDTAVYTYTYAEEQDKAAVAAEIKKQEADLRKTVEREVFPAMARSGVEPTQKVRFTYLNPDGSEIVTLEFSNQ